MCLTTSGGLPPLGLAEQLPSVVRLTGQRAELSQQRAGEAWYVLTVGDPGGETGCPESRASRERTRRSSCPAAFG